MRVTTSTVKGPHRAMVGVTEGLEHHLPEFEILAVTEPTTVVYARVRASLKKLGRRVPANDAWIAALALQHHLAVMSRDEHFDAVPGLRREAW